MRLRGRLATQRRVNWLSTEMVTMRAYPTLISGSISANSTRWR